MKEKSRSMLNPSLPRFSRSSESRKYPSSFSKPSTSPKNRSSPSNSMAYQVQEKSGKKNFTRRSGSASPSVVPRSGRLSRTAFGKSSSSVIGVFVLNGYYRKTRPRLPAGSGKPVEVLAESRWSSSRRRRERTTLTARGGG